MFYINFLVGVGQIFLPPATTTHWLRSSTVIAVYVPIPLSGKAEFQVRSLSYEYKDGLGSIPNCDEPNQRERMKH